MPKKTKSEKSSRKPVKRRAQKKKSTVKKRVTTKKRAARGTRKTSETSGPITLAEARSLISPRKTNAPKRRRGAKKKAVGHPPGNEIAKAKRKRDKEVRSERVQREKDFKKMMTLMKRRGVEGLPSEAPTAKRRRGRASSNAPLQILAEGDSWFDYPVPFFGGGIIPRLEDLVGLPILNLAKAGDEVRNMLGVEERKVLTKQLTSGSPAGGKWDVLLFSGGGNDIVGEPMALWIREFSRNVTPAKLINQARFQSALDLVQAGYEDLILLRDSLSPDTHLIFHAYDFAIPDGRGICFMGPWMKPTFDVRNFKTRAPATAVVKEMLQQFAKMLKKLERTHKNVTFIDTQGTLAASTRSWHNELHPSKSGFKKFAKLFHKQIKSKYPNRVL